MFAHESKRSSEQKSTEMKPILLETVYKIWDIKALPDQRCVVYYRHKEDPSYGYFKIFDPITKKESEPVRIHTSKKMPENLWGAKNIALSNGVY